MGNPLQCHLSPCCDAHSRRADQPCRSQPALHLADDGALNYWRTANYRVHAYYAYALNGLFLLLVGALIWRPRSQGTCFSIKDGQVGKGQIPTTKLSWQQYVLRS
jgi:hypothetical protein